MTGELERYLAEIPEAIAAACAPVFAALPLDRAMTALVPEAGVGGEGFAAVEAALNAEAIRSRPALVAGLWLYVDELDRSHEISQGMPDATGSFWHGIMHRREGDFSNAHYWFSRAGQHPAMASIGGYDGHEFVDAVAANHRENPADLVAMQRSEWAAFFAWCAVQ